MSDFAVLTQNQLKSLFFNVNTRKQKHACSKLMTASSHFLQMVLFAQNISKMKKRKTESIGKKGDKNAKGNN